MDEPPETMTDAEMQRHFENGPRVKGAVLVLVNDRLYKREGAIWRLLDDKAHPDVKELTDGS